MTSTASSATALWYSLQYSLNVDAAGPGSAPARNLVSVRIPRYRMISTWRSAEARRWRIRGSRGPAAFPGPS